MTKNKRLKKLGVGVETTRGIAVDETFWTLTGPFLWDRIKSFIIDWLYSLISLIERLGRKK